MSVEGAMAAFKIGSQIMGYFGGQQTVSNTIQAANNNLMANNAILDQKSSEIKADAANEISERAKQAMVETARMRVLAGESGVAGNSVDAQLRDSEMQRVTDVASIETNKSNRIKQVSNERKAQVSKSQSTINEAQSKAPTLLGTGLQIADTAGSYYTNTRRGSTSINTPTVTK